MKIGMKAIGLWRWNSLAIPRLDEWQEYDEYGYFPRKRKERKERQRKRKERSWTFRTRKRTRWWERRSKLCEPITFFSTDSAASSSTFVSECLWFLCDTFRCKLDISQGNTGWRSEYGAWSFSCAFLGQEANPVQKVEEEGVAFHTENQMPPTVAILDLGCTRAMGSRNAVNAFCDYVDNNDCGLWYKIEPTSSRDFSLRTLSKPSAQRSWWFTCMTSHGVCTPRSLTLWKKEMYHCWCHFHRWETLVFNLSFHHRSHSWTVQDQRWEWLKHYRLERK